MTRTERKNLVYFIAFVVLLFVWGWMNTNIGGA